MAQPSLIERAADIYDFQAVLRARAKPLPEVELELVSAVLLAPEPDRVDPTPTTVGVERSRDTGQDYSTSPIHAFDSAPVDREALREAGYILPDAPVGALAEEFRIVKRQLLLTARAEGGKARMILVCSAQPDEGKSFCAVNLALSMAQEHDFEVLLVDADVAKPEILSTLGLEGGPGLLDAMADPALDVESCVIRTDIPHLSVLPAGSHTHVATELIASDRTRSVLDRLAEVPNRIILFDSPPALAASPASVLALHVGQAVMVVRADATSESDLREAIGLLSGCEDIRLLLNGVSFGGKDRRFGRYYGFGDT